MEWLNLYLLNEITNTIFPFSFLWDWWSSKDDTNVLGQSLFTNRCHGVWWFNNSYRYYHFLPTKMTDVASNTFDILLFDVSEIWRCNIFNIKLRRKQLLREACLGCWSCRQCRRHVSILVIISPMKRVENFLQKNFEFLGVEKVAFILEITTLHSRIEFKSP